MGLKEISLAIPILLATLIGIIKLFVSTFGMIDSEKLFITNEQKIINYIKECFKGFLFFCYLTALFTLLLSGIKEYYDFVTNVEIYSLISIITAFLFMFTLSLNIIYTKKNTIKDKYKEKFKNYIPWFKCIYPKLNVTLFLLLSLLILLASAVFCSFLIKNNAIKTNNLFPIILILLAFYTLNVFFYHAFISLAEIYKKKQYRISLKTKDNNIFKDLYLYSNNNKRITFGEEPKHFSSRKFLILNKDIIDYYVIKVETYSWGKLIKESTENTDESPNQ